MGLPASGGKHAYPNCGWCDDSGVASIYGAEAVAAWGVGKSTRIYR